MFTKLLMVKGREVVSAIKPQPMINGKITRLLAFNVRMMANTIGVKMSAPPSLAKKALINALRINM
mgnify:CR=1 FL=1